MYDNMNQLEKDFNTRLFNMRKRLLDIEIMFKDLFADSLWDEEDNADIREAFEEIQKSLDELKEMFD